MVMGPPRRRAGPSGEIYRVLADAVAGPRRVRGVSDGGRTRDLQDHNLAL